MFQEDTVLPPAAASQSGRSCDGGVGVIHGARHRIWNCGRSWCHSYCGGRPGSWGNELDGGATSSIVAISAGNARIAGSGLRLLGCDKASHPTHLAEEKGKKVLCRIETARLWRTFFPLILGWV